MRLSQHIAQKNMTNSFISADFESVEMESMAIDSLVQSMSLDLKELDKAYSVEAEFQSIYDEAERLRASGSFDNIIFQNKITSSLEAHEINLPIEVAMPSFEADEKDKKPEEKKGILAKIKKFIMELFATISKKFKALINFFKKRNISINNTVAQLIKALEQIDDKQEPSKTVTVSVMSTYDPNKTKNLVNVLVASNIKVLTYAKDLSVACDLFEKKHFEDLNKNDTLKDIAAFIGLVSLPIELPFGASLKFTSDGKDLEWNVKETTNHNVTVEKVWKPSEILSELRKFSAAKADNDKLMGFSYKISIFADKIGDKVEEISKRGGEPEDIQKACKALAIFANRLGVVDSFLGWRESDILKILAGMAGAYKVRKSTADAKGFGVDDKSE